MMGLKQVNLFFISKLNVNKEKYQALLADHQADGRGPPVVRGPQVENRCSRYIYVYIDIWGALNELAHGACQAVSLLHLSGCLGSLFLKSITPIHNKYYPMQ